MRLRVGCVRAAVVVVAVVAGCCGGALTLRDSNEPKKCDGNDDIVTNVDNDDTNVNDDDDDSLSLVWECGNICNSYLCETETCRRALRATLLQRIEELEKKLLEQDVRNTGQEKKVKKNI